MQPSRRHGDKMHNADFVRLPQCICTMSTQYRPAAALADDIRSLVLIRLSLIPDVFALVRNK